MSPAGYSLDLGGGVLLNYSPKTLKKTAKYLNHNTRITLLISKKSSVILMMKKMPAKKVKSQLLRLMSGTLRALIKKSRSPLLIHTYSGGHK